MVRRILCIIGRVKEAIIKKYIEKQEKHDIALDKLSVKEYKGLLRRASNTNAPFEAAKEARA